MKRLQHSISCCISVWLLLSAANVQALDHLDQATPPSLIITVYDYPPDIYNAKTKPEGPLIDITRSILYAAGIPFTWLSTSFALEGDMLNEGTRPFCTTGRVYTPERAERWSFLPYIMFRVTSDAFLIHKDKIHKFASLKSLKAIIQSDKVTGAFVRNGAYGVEIDPQLAKQVPWMNQNAENSIQTMSMVLAGRADYTIVLQAQWDAERVKNPALNDLINIRPLIKDRKPTNIFMVCSHAVPTATLEKLTTAMASLGFTLADSPIISPIAIPQP